MAQAEPTTKLAAVQAKEIAPGVVDMKFRVLAADPLARYRLNGDIAIMAVYATLTDTDTGAQFQYNGPGQAGWWLAPWAFTEQSQALHFPVQVGLPGDPVVLLVRYIPSGWYYDGLPHFTTHINSVEYGTNNTAEIHNYYTGYPIDVVPFTVRVGSTRR
jgi:hypothetical protein